VQELVGECHDLSGELEDELEAAGVELSQVGAQDRTQRRIFSRG
jgi:hypothetical protein